MSASSQITDDWPEAVYTEQIDPDYVGNPFIEALPPIRDDGEAIEAMQRIVRVTKAEIQLPAIHRIHMLKRINTFMQPLEANVELFHRISADVRGGYVARNPTSPKFVRDLTEASAELTRLAKEMATPGLGRVKAGTRQRIGVGSSLTLIGTSGVGKTTAVEAVLRCYDQVICHSAIRGPIAAVYQLVWLKLSIPADGSIKALCIDFFAAVDELLDTGYTRLYVGSHATVDKLIVVMGRVSFIHGLGLLVIDELQNLNVANSGGAEKMMNTFKFLRDVMKVPVLSIGTPEAIAVLSGDLQVARRNSGLEPMLRMKLDDEFRLFCRSLFDAQFLREPAAPDEETIAKLHWLSQGIADVVVQMFVAAQRYALSSGVETIAPSMFDRAYERTQTLLHTFLDDIRSGRQVDGPEFDRALGATKKASQAASPAPAAPFAPSVAPVVGGVAKRRSRAKGEPSGCLLVRTVEAGTARQISAHQALTEAGFIRPLGAEALAA